MHWFVNGSKSFLRVQFWAIQAPHHRTTCFCFLSTCPATPVKSCKCETVAFALVWRPSGPQKPLSEIRMQMNRSSTTITPSLFLSWWGIFTQKQFRMQFGGSGVWGSDGTRAQRGAGGAPGPFSLRKWALIKEAKRQALSFSGHWLSSRGLFQST